MLDLRQSNSYAKYMKLLGWNVVRRSGVFTYVKDLKVFSVLKMQRPENLIQSHLLNNIASKQNGIAVFYIEPKSKDQQKEFKKHGYKGIGSSSLPSKTIRFDLKRSDDELMQNMHHKTRYNIRLSKRRGVKVEEGDNVKEFSDFWHNSAKKRGMHLSLKKEIECIYKAFDNNAQILWAKKDNDKLAAILILYTEEAGYYMYAASSSIGNKHQSPSLLVWSGIQESKKRRLKYFDFEGIYDNRFPIRSWKGFSRFKKSFGGEIIEFPGSMRRFYLPFINY